MGRWIDWRIEAASWRGLLIWLVLLFAYSYWAFFTNSPWTIASDAYSALPEMSAGFKADQPAAAINGLGTARGAYILFQLADLAYTALNTLVYATVFGLALKRFNWSKTPARFSLFIPLAYAVAEVIENALLALMAGGILPAEGVLAMAQQLATTVKFSSGMPAGLFTLIGLVALAIAALVSRVRGKP